MMLVMKIVQVMEKKLVSVTVTITLGFFFLMYKVRSFPNFLLFLK